MPTKMFKITVHLKSKEEGDEEGSRLFSVFVEAENADDAEEVIQSLQNRTHKCIEADW